MNDLLENFTKLPEIRTFNAKKLLSGLAPMTMIIHTNRTRNFNKYLLVMLVLLKGAQGFGLVGAAFVFRRIRSETNIILKNATIKGSQTAHHTVTKL
jgi:hypothetical protein